jgi:hypothetical protein
MGCGEVRDRHTLALRSCFLQHFRRFCKTDVVEPLVIDGQDLVPGPNTTVLSHGPLHRFHQNVTGLTVLRETQTQAGAGLSDVNLSWVVVQFTAVVIVTHIRRQATIRDTVLRTGVSDLRLDGTDHCPIINKVRVRKTYSVEGALTCA